LLEQGVIELLESGCALIVGLVTADGNPLAGRGWGLTLHDGGTRGRILVNPLDLARLGHGWPQAVGSWIAVTGANVLSLSSAQVKGPITALEPADDGDWGTCARFCDRFFDDVEIVDSIPRWMMERLVPGELVAVEFEVVEAYDQTPGPGAGAQLRGGRDARA
jgi:hypothetical protein